MKSQPYFPYWPYLIDDVKLKIIPMLNYSTRRALRICSKKDKQLVDMFPYRKEMIFKCILRGLRKKWHCKYYDDRPRGYVSHATFGKHFVELGDAHHFMRDVIKTAEIITFLKLDLEVNAKIDLRHGNKLVKVNGMSLIFDFSNCGDGKKNESFDHLFAQIDVSRLKRLSINMPDLRNDQFCLSDPFFELEKTILKLDRFRLYGPINDKQMLGLKVLTADLIDAGNITPTAFKEFITRTLLKPPPDLDFNFDNINSDMQMYLFGEVYEEAGLVHEFLFNTVGSPDFKMLIRFYSENIAGPYDWVQDVRGFIDVKLYPINSFHHQRGPFQVNAAALDAYPDLQNFVDEIASELPRGFPLMRDSRQR